jgi:predicted NBD/HSP70 family sugar kinase
MTTTHADVNRSAILAQLGARGALSRIELSDILGVSPALITQLVKDLLREGLIHEAGHADSSGGRRAMRLQLSVDVGTAIGVKVAADHLVAVEVRIDGTVVRSVSEPFAADSRAAVSVLAEHVKRFIATGSERHILGVGVGVPGTVADPEAGVVDSTQLAWTGVPLGRELRSTLGLPVLVDNNVNAVALTQLIYGSAQGFADVLVVTIGTGVGAGLVLDGTIRRGYAGAAGEIGHVPVAADGPPCHCGNRGCLESQIGEQALLDRAVQVGLVGPNASADALRSLADAEDGTAREIFADAGRTFGRALAGVVNTLAPEAVILMGEGVVAWKHWRPGFDGAFRGALNHYTRSVELRVEDWSDDRWAQGGACLVLATPFGATNSTGEQVRLVRQRLSVVSSREAM